MRAAAAHAGRSRMDVDERAAAPMNADDLMAASRDRIMTILAREAGKMLDDGTAGSARRWTSCATTPARRGR